MQIEVIGSFAFIVSCFAWLFQWGYLRHYKKEINRHGLTGGEAARTLCDMFGFAHAVIDFKPQDLSARKNPQQIKFLCLPKALFEGNSLYALARAGHEVVIMIESPITFLPLKKRWRIVSIFSCLAWGFLAADVLGFLPGGFILCPLLFFAAFMAALFFVPNEWEIAERVVTIYRQANILELDEVLKIKEMMAGIRLESFALIVKSPLTILINKLRTVRIF